MATHAFSAGGTVPVRATSIDARRKQPTASQAGNSPAALPAPSAIEGMARRVVLPARYMRLEPPIPLSAVNDDPVFDDRSASTILGVTVAAMKKWRQRHQGPDYYQYGDNGPVRYALSTLQAFKEDHLIIVGGLE